VDGRAEKEQGADDGRRRRYRQGREESERRERAVVHREVEGLAVADVHIQIREEPAEEPGNESDRS